MKKFFVVVGVLALLVGGGWLVRAFTTVKAKALQGQNPKKVIIGLGRKLEQNGKGEFVDPWGNALRFYFSDNSVLVRSSGPNGRFEESTSMEFDDYIRSN